MARWAGWLGSNAIIAAATVVTAGYAVSQYYFGKQTQAAVIIPTLEISSTQVAGSSPYWTIAPHISNQGNSTSGNVQAIMGTMYRDNVLFKKLPNFTDGPTNPDVNEISFDEDNNVVVLRKDFYGRPKINPPHKSIAVGGIGPKQDIQLGILAIPQTEATLLKSGAETLFIIGRVNYQDTYSENVWHVAKFCYRVYGNASDTENFSKWGERPVGVYDPGDLRLTYRLCSFNNCSDNQCSSQQ